MCDRDGFRNCVTLTFDLLTSGCRATTIEYLCTKFGVESSSHFPFRAWTNRQTDATERIAHTGGYSGLGNNTTTNNNVNGAVIMPKLLLEFTWFIC